MPWQLPWELLTVAGSSIVDFPNGDVNHKMLDMLPVTPVAKDGVPELEQPTPNAMTNQSDASFLLILGRSLIELPALSEKSS